MGEPSRGWCRAIALTWFSLSGVACSNQDPSELDVGQSALALEADGGVCEPVPGATLDTSCDDVDDDCDGALDEDYRTRCMFLLASIQCEAGRVVVRNCNDNNPCTADSCGTNGCVNTPISCDDGNPCTADSCDPQVGCGSVIMPGLACPSGDACFAGACDAAGSCVGSEPIAVDDGNPCTDDACDPATGVTHVPAIGRACDDGNICSQTDTCNASGSCSGVPAAGLDDGDSCTDDLCDPVSGAISHVVLPGGASCSDGDVCNGVEVCQGTPESSVPVTGFQTFLRASQGDNATAPRVFALADLDIAPGQEVELRTQGQFNGTVTRALAVFSTSSVVLASTVQERVPGAVQSAAPPVMTGNTYLDGLPTNIAQDFVIDRASLVVVVPAGAQYLVLGVNDSYYADNSGALTVVVKVVEGRCVEGQAPSLDDANGCTADLCDPVSGVSHEPVADGTACEAAGAAGACSAGVCVP
jgi:hypothetical protein